VPRICNTHLNSPSKSAFRNPNSEISSRSLVERIAALAVKVVKIFRLDEIETRVGHAFQQRDHLRMRHAGAVRFGKKTTAPVVGTKRFRMTAGPNFHTAIAHHLELRPVAAEFAERVAEIVR